ncbi:alpha/beta fold hydrolase [Nocardia asiatica]
MIETNIDSLTVPGARLTYETCGSGPLMVMIPGATGVAAGFRATATHLARRFTVLLYDRRGFSRSALTGEQDYRRRLETDADDVRRLIEHIGIGPAAVFGTSSGALIALAVLTRSPHAVDTLIAFEPPAMRLLADGQRWLDLFSDLYQHYRQCGPQEALHEFRELTFAESDRRAMARAPRKDADLVYWFEHELRQYPATELDLDSLVERADRIVPAIGQDSIGYPAASATIELARRLARAVLEFPGGHIGHLTRTPDFAARLLELLLDPSARAQ